MVHVPKNKARYKSQQKPKRVGACGERFLVTLIPRHSISPKIVATFNAKEPGRRDSVLLGLLRSFTTACVRQHWVLCFIADVA